jgi:fatty-acyl-CoA synthase
MDAPSRRFAGATTPALLDTLARERGAHPALTDVAETLDFSTTRTRVRELAKALHAQGVRPGHVVGVLAGNRNEWVVACMASHYLGAAVVAINTWYTERELAHLLEHADVHTLITTGRFLKSDFVSMLTRMQPWEQTLPELRQVVVLYDPPGEGMIGYDDFVTLGAAVPDAVIDALRDQVSSEDLALLLYTSGSTSKPKGVRLLHAGLLANCFDIGERAGFTADDVLLLPISLFWGFGCSNALPAAWTHGMHIVLQEHFEADQSLRLIEDHKCTAIYGTPNIMQALVDAVGAGEHDVSSLGKGLTWGTREQMQQVVSRLATQISHIFGFTEGYGNSAVAGTGDPLEKRLTTVGRVLPGSELRIVDPVLELECAPGLVGEIRIRGHIMAGYHKEPALTATAFDKDGFYKTGDLGSVDEEGFLQFRGRLKEIIKTGGMNVSPAEVEEILRSHPSIVDAFVTALPDEVRDEIVAAVLILGEDAVLDHDGVIAHCRQALSSYKVPRRLVAVTSDQLPLTSTRKLHRARLHELFGTPG